MRDTRGAEIVAEDQAQELAPAETSTALMTVEDCIGQLQQLRAVVMPMIEACRDEYQDRCRPRHPYVIDNIERGGVFGINLDPGFGAYFMTDGQDVYGEIHRVDLRTDTLSAANYEKFSGRPALERIDLDLTGDLIRQSRNIISRLLSYWNQQQTNLFRVDS